MRNVTILQDTRTRYWDHAIMVYGVTNRFGSAKLCGALAAIVWGGLLAGILDGMDAIVSVWLRGISPTRLFQFIASSVLGSSAFQGGWAAVVLGCYLHFSIAIGAALVYYLLSLGFTVFIRRPLLYGPVYGLGVFLVMHYVVVPLSAAPPQPKPTPLLYLNQLFTHAFFVGLPIGLVRSWAGREKTSLKIVALEEAGG